ncbi:SGNH/GDSL hydrolase family protein [Anthocerotibacter panamensis]|uniref:SGNH/GDSL hydrolase family protein n=1 Tax=Anthocerotibacter panamensis TaxID=2857077 RepID=UPI001C40165A|nr:SGNH/GDSL hydrolase family protein [Anthocerotibacter panamensis]
MGSGRLPLGAGGVKVVAAHVARLPTLIILIVGVFGGWRSVRAQPFSGMYVFGDSLSDIGQVYRATNTQVPPSPPYLAGRFCDGPLWVEDLALGLGLSLDLRHDFAFSGATSGTTNTLAQQFPGLLGLQQQVDRYVATDGRADPGALYVMLAGANDYLSFTETNPAVPVANVIQATNKLIAAGAKNFLVANLPDLGLIPRIVGTPVASVFHGLILEHNARLQVALDQLQQRTGVNISLLDVYTLLNDMAGNPAQYRFTQVTEPCLTLLLIPCRNPEQYLFYDEIHPTTAAHRYAAQRALRKVLKVSKRPPGLIQER